MRAVVAIPLKQRLIFNQTRRTIRQYATVAIPLEQGLIFNTGLFRIIRRWNVAIPLEQGLIFNQWGKTKRFLMSVSQSL